MNTSLFDKFSAAIRAGAAPDDARLQLGVSGSLAVHYAPFEAVNSGAKLVLVGITPGRVQAANALQEARRQLEMGASAHDAMRKAKQVGAFSGPMQVPAEPLPQVSQEWLQLAEQAVGDLDPSGKRLGMLEQGVQPGYEGPFGKKLVTELRPGQPPYL